MSKEEIAKKYLSYLENGEIDKVVNLFSDKGVVVSPIYGTMPANGFYKTLAEDTNESELRFDGLFYEEKSNRVSLLFDYIWTLKNDKKIEFKVVDIIEFNTEHKIQKLTIIYDTVQSRVAVEGLKE